METPTPLPEEEITPQPPSQYEPMGKPSGKFGPGLWIVLGLSLIALVGILFLFTSVLPNAISAFAGVNLYQEEPRLDIQTDITTEESLPVAVEPEELSPEELNSGLIESCEEIIDIAEDNMEVYSDMGASDHVEAWENVRNLWIEVLEACYIDDIDAIETLGDEAIQALDDAMALPMPS